MSRIRILHFNDCYNVETNVEEPVAGAARFKTALNSFTDDNTLVLFSGDIMAPSIISTFTSGEHMIPVLNQCQVACAVFGNHEFEFGVQHLVQFTEKTSFPWLMSNLMDRRTGKPMAGAKDFHVMEKSGLRIGLIGLVEQEWLSTLGSNSDPDDQIYLNFVDQAQNYASYLKQELKVDFVIALTHMRWPNDCRLAATVPSIDLILGGHDHEYGVKKVDGRLIVKSGSDFRTFSKIDVNFDATAKASISVQKVEVTSDFAEDADLKQVLNQYTDVMESKMGIELARFDVDLDCRFAVIRTQETLFGNLVTDLMREQNKADICFINSGTFRSDRIHLAAANFTFRDLVTLIPKVSPAVVLIATGAQIHTALENGVSQFPKLEGRFPQVSGITFAFDPAKEPNSRILRSHIKIRGEALIAEQTYKLATKAFLADGRDGYLVLKDCPVHADEETCHAPPLIVQQFFDRVKGTVISPKLQQRIVNLADKQ